jgi:translation elongation factor EF-1alpha
MKDAAVQADVGVLVISAKADEYMSGIFNGTTLEHARVLASQGIKQLIILINKMDTVDTTQDEDAADKKAGLISMTLGVELMKPENGNFAREAMTFFKVAINPFGKKQTNGIDKFIKYLDKLVIVKNDEKPLVAQIIDKVCDKGAQFITVAVKQGKITSG